MKPQTSLIHEFVEYIPNDLRDNTIYVSIAFATVMHKCCCGCGNEVVTPLSPTDWKLIFDGQSISLDPSIGNWSYACQSHYWIKNNRVKWTPRWSKEKINSGRIHDLLVKEKHYNSEITNVKDSIAGIGEPEDNKSKKSFWEKLKNWLF